MRQKSFLKILIALTLLTTLLSFQNCSGQFRTISEFAELSSNAISNIADFDINSVSSSASAPYSVAKTLSREESLNVAKDIVGANLISDQLIYLLPPDEKTAGFESATVKLFNEAFVQGRLKFSEAVVEAALNSPQVMTCQLGFAEGVPWAGCIQNIITQFATRVYSRAPTSQELTELQSIYQNSTRTVVGFLGNSLRGNLDTVTPNLEAQGWSLDPSWSERPVQIHFYVNGAAGAGGTFAGATVTRLARPDVTSFFAQSEQANYTGNFGFSFQLPAQFANGQNNTLHAYALGGDGRAGVNTLIGTLTFRVGAVTPIANNANGLGVSTKEGLKNALLRVMMSPSFILRAPPQATGESTIAFQNRRFARKLALFLTGSLPDNALLQAADQGELSDPELLRSHATRLLDQNLGRFVSNSFGQWFEFRDFSRVTELTSVERAMVTESRMVFEEILRQQLPIDSILMPGFTFLNQELANNYGISGVTSSNFVRVDQQQRGGILTQGSILRLTSPTATTKVIQRGKWIMTNLLCQTIILPDNSLRQMEIAASLSQLPAGASVKETLAFHRSRGPSCANCHRQMDPLGLSLEVFDSFGRPRTSYPDAKPVEADGVLNGVAFNGPYQLAPIIAQQQFKNCVSRKLITHGLGRELEMSEDRIAMGLSGSTNVKELILRIATSRIFLDESRRNQ